MGKVNLKRLLSADKIIPFYSRRRSIPSLEQPPVAIELHWTSDCNYDCVHCSYGSRRLSKGRLSNECIETLVDDLVSMKVSSVYLSGGGEPTVVKGWESYADRILNADIEMALITNGVALRRSHSYVLARMNYVAVSVYSTLGKTYKSITDSNQFDRQWTAPEIIKSGGGRVIVGARCVINKLNYRDILDIYRRAKDSNYDYIIFIPAVDYEGRGIGLGPDEQAVVGALISDNSHVFDPTFSNALDLPLREIGHYSPKDYRSNFLNPVLQCSAITIGANAFVNYCGGVWLCQPHIGNPTYQIGNVNESRFVEIWNSPTHRKVIELLNEEFCKGRCRNCRSIAFNIAANKYDQGVLPSDGIPYDPFV